MKTRNNWISVKWLHNHNKSMLDVNWNKNINLRYKSVYNSSICLFTFIILSYSFLLLHYLLLYYVYFTLFCNNSSLYKFNTKYSVIVTHFLYLILASVLFSFYYLSSVWLVLKFHSLLFLCYKCLVSLV